MYSAARAADCLCHQKALQFQRNLINETLRRRMEVSRYVFAVVYLYSKATGGNACEADSECAILAIMQE
jgi:hypothetical protein